MRKLNCLQQLPNLTGAPAVSNTAGSLYLENTDSRLYASDGTTWRKVAYLDDVPGQGSSTIDVDFPVGTEYTWTITDSNATIGKSVVARHANGGTTKLGIKQPYRQFEAPDLVSPQINSIRWFGDAFYAVGDYGFFAKSYDGINWTTYDSFTDSGIFSNIIDIATDGIDIYALTTSDVYRSYDKGLSWNSDYTSMIGALFVIAQGSGGELTIFGEIGCIQMTSKGVWNNGTTGEIWSKWGGVYANAMCYGNAAAYLIVGDGGHTATKLTGGSRTFVDTSSGLQATTWGTSNVYCTTYTNSSTYIIGGGSGKIAYSPDGSTWTISTIPSHPLWATMDVRTISYDGNGKLMAIASSSTTSLYAYSLDDGVTWSYGTEFTGTYGVPIKASAYGTNRFVIGDSTGMVANTTVYSPNTFSDFNANLLSTGWGTTTMWAIAENKTSGTIVAVGEYASAAYSIDGGVTWLKDTNITSLINDSSQTIEFVVHNGSVFFATITSGRAFTSIDGITWVEQTSLNSSIIGAICTCTSCGSRIICFTSKSPMMCVYSDDNGVTWTTSTSFETDTVSIGAVYPAYTTTVLGTTIHAFGGYGLYAVSNDSGTTWTEPQFLTGLSPYSIRLATRLKSTICCFSSNGISTSFDGGQSWIKTNPFPEQTTESDIHMVSSDPSTGTFFVFFDNIGYSSKDCVTWNRLYIDNIDRYTPWAFIKTNTCRLLACSNGRIFMSKSVDFDQWTDKYVEFSATDDTDVDPIMIRGFIPETGKITFKAKSKTITSGTKKVTYTIK